MEVKADRYEKRFKDWYKQCVKVSKSWNSPRRQIMFSDGVLGWESSEEYV